MTDYLLEKFRKRFIMNQRTITWSVLKMPISLILFGVIRKNRYICTISIICQSWELVFDCKHEECYDRRTMAMAGAWNGVEGCLHLSYYADSAVAQCLFSLYRSIVSEWVSEWVAKILEWPKISVIISAPLTLFDLRPKQLMPSRARTPLALLSLSRCILSRILIGLWLGVGWY